MKARWRGPGRVNLIGEHTDYNEGFVLPFALELGCVAEVSRESVGWTVTSAQRGEQVVVSCDSTPRESVPQWSRYVLGVLWLLAERGVEVPGLSIVVDSDVPEGAGLASSAALVCSTLCAVQDHLGLDLSTADLLELSREVENVVVGSPTGGMDQLVCLRGVAGHALLCDMRSLTSRPVPFVPESYGLSLLVVDTRSPHRHVDGEYAARRAACAAAAAELGVPALRDVVADDLPAALARLEDPWLRRVVRHVVTENGRVLRTADLLCEGRIEAIGPLLDESHASMRDDFAITVPTVDTAWEALRRAGALGARMTGGGFGGCVIGLVPERDADSAGDAVRAAFADAGFEEPALFTATPSAGAGIVAG